MSESQEQFETRLGLRPRQDVARLAKWAQQYVGDLERNVAELTQRVAQLSEGPAESDTVVDGLGIYPDRELGIGVPVTFRLPDHSVIRAVVRGPYVELNALGPDFASWSILAQPSSGNVLRVRPGEWW